MNNMTMVVPAWLATIGIAAAAPALALAQDRAAGPRTFAAAGGAYPSQEVVVEARRASADERIQAEVIDRLSADPRLEGRIGVQSQDTAVTLSGWTRTAAQASRAADDARSVDEVTAVHNGIRPRMDGSAW